MNQSISSPSFHTPAPILDLDKLEANIREMQRVANQAGVRLRPHTKCHECATIAKMQIEAGACGIEVDTVDKAELMANEGLKDIIVAHPFYGADKLETLKRILANRKAKIGVVVDMIDQAIGVSEIAQSVGTMVPALMKVETGCRRFGVSPGEPALKLAQQVSHLPGIQFSGIYAHEAVITPKAATAEGIDKEAFEVATIAVETAKLLKREGIPVENVTVGGSPTLYSTCRYIQEGRFPEITEIHPGSRVIGDILYVKTGGTTMGECALTVLTAVMSTTHDEWAVIDAGYKTFGADSLIGFRDTIGYFRNGRPSFGSVQGRPDLWFGRLSTEAACVYYTEPEKKLSVGERLQIIPNNAILVIHLHDKLYGVRKGVVEKVIAVTGGCRAN